MSGSPPKIRLDKWLWHARFFKTRTLAAEIAGSGVVRLNGNRVSKASQQVQSGDVLTFPLGRHARVIRVEALGLRRGPAAEAQELYTDLAPPEPQSDAVPSVSETRGGGRPTKRDRREIDALRRREP